MDERRIAGQRRRSLPFAWLRGDRRPAAVRYLRRPALERSIVLAAFEGWNDAGEAASSALGYLARSWGASAVAEIDAEEFFDFTEVRPEVAIVDGGAREIAWPSTSVSVALSPPGERDVVLVRGHEPQLHWRGYCAAVAEVAKALNAEHVVTLGAYLSEVIHGRPVPVNAVSSHRGLLDRLDIAPSHYEGPTGIVGVLGLALPEAGIPTTSVWASVPCYSLPVSAKATLALVRVVTRITGRTVDTTELEEQAAEYERHMDELVREDEGVAAYVARLEEMQEVVGSELSAEGLAEEIERFLRNKRRS
jgi:proteasome assembly chaperone (PAC2) family protein